MKVEQIMIKDVISVSSKTSIAEVAHTLTDNKIHGVPVINAGKVIGIITETDFFVKDLADIYLPSYIDFLKKAEFAERVSKKQETEIKKLLEATAGDIMTKGCTTVKADSKVKDLLKLFRDKHLFTIPVTDKANNLIGIITQADIINLIKI